MSLLSIAKRVASLGSVGLLLAIQAFSQVATIERYGVGYLAVPPTAKLGNAWAMRPWSGSARPYEQARREIEARFARAGFDTERDIARLGREGAASPESSLAQFRWATVAFLAARQDGESGRDRWSGRQGIDARGRVRWALALARDPANAEYDRIRFIFEASQSSADLFRELGKRLALKWPSDDALRRNRAMNLANSKHAQDVDLAIGLTHALTKESPNRLRIVALEGDVAQAAWMNLHRRADGLACIQWTERFLQIAPAGDSHRDGLEHRLKYLKEKLEV